MKRRNCLRGLVGLLAGLVLPTAAFAMQTLRNPPQYLSTDAARVHDTCPGHNILSRFTCSAKEPPGFSCFDVYLVEGDPVADEHYRLLDQTLDVKNVTAEPVWQAGTSSALAPRSTSQARQRSSAANRSAGCPSSRLAANSASYLLCSSPQRARACV